MNDLDERVHDAVASLPGKERRAMMHARYRSCVDSLSDELDAGEQVQEITCANNASLGRGVLALTESRLLFSCTRSGAASWQLQDVRGIVERASAFTLPSAMTVDVGAKRQVFTLGAGRRYGPTFVAAVEAAVPAAGGKAA